MMYSSRTNVNVQVVYDGAVIEFVQCIKCLGVDLDDKLNFKQHITGVVARVNYSLRGLYTTNLCLPPFVKERLAHALVMPNILYCLEVFSAANQKNVKPVELAINRVIRYVYNLRRREHITPFAIKFLGCTFSAYIDMRLILFFL